MENEGKGRVFQIQKFSVHDGPGIRTTVFLKGCPLRCRWCSNPESQHPDFQVGYNRRLCIGCKKCRAVCGQDGGEKGFSFSLCAKCNDPACLSVCPSGALTRYGRDMTVAQVMAQVDKDARYYQTSGGGVTFSGGEPLAQAEFLGQALRACKERGYHTAVETCGHAPWESIEPLLPLIDLFLFDIKHVDPERMLAHTGADGRQILRNLEAILSRGAALTARTPVVPGFNDTREHMAAIAALIAGLGIAHWHLLPYHGMGKSKYDSLSREYALGNVTAPPDDAMERFCSIGQEAGIATQVGG